MTAHYFYTSPTTPGNAGWSTEILNGVRLAHGDQQGVIDQAQVGAVGASSVEVDDPDATLDFLSDKGWHIVEDECPLGDQRLWTGYIGDQKIGRGGENQIGPGRQWTLTLVPIESFLHFRIFENDDANRPAETDLERLTWILEYEYFSDTLYDEGLIDWTGPVKVDADDCRGKFLDEVLAALSTKSTKNHWLDYHEATGHYRLAYLLNNSPTPSFDSAVRLTNIDAEVLSDDTGMTLPVLMPPDGNDAELERLSGRIAAGVRQEFAGTAGGTNFVYLTNPLTGNKYGFRDQLSQDTTIKTEAAARAQANVYLGQNATPDLLLHCSVWTPAHLATAIKKGQRVQCKFSHLSTPSSPVFADWPGWGRVIQKTIRRDKPTPHFYTIDYDITPAPPPPCDPSLSYAAHYTPALGGLGATPNPVVDPMGPYYMKAGNILDMPDVGSVTFVQYPNFEYAFPGTQGPWVDKFPAGYDDTIDIYCQGDGTLTVRLVSIPHVLEYPNAQIDAIQYDYVALPIAWGDNSTPNYIGSATLLGSTTVPNVITEYSFHVVSVDPTKVTCYHYVHIEFQTPAGLAPGTACYIGLDGFTWQPDP